jgi:hypothetical protein
VLLAATVVLQVGALEAILSYHLEILIDPEERIDLQTLPPDPGPNAARALQKGKAAAT